MQIRHSAALDFIARAKPQNSNNAEAVECQELSAAVLMLA